MHIHTYIHTLKANVYLSRPLCSFALFHLSSSYRGKYLRSNLRKKYKSQSVWTNLSSRQIACISTFERMKGKIEIHMGHLGFSWIKRRYTSRGLFSHLVRRQSKLSKGNEMKENVSHFRLDITRIVPCLVGDSGHHSLNPCLVYQKNVKC